jgi:hypothetical protein
MSGFLDQLIARGLGVSEVIRPRARLLFEPQPADITPLKPAAFGKSEFEEVATLPEAPMRPPGRETIERNYREPVGADGDIAATRLRPPALVEPRDIASGIRSGPVKVEDPPRLSPAVNAENRAARAAFDEGVPPHQVEVGPPAIPPPPPRENASVAVVVRSSTSEAAQDSTVNLCATDRSSHSIGSPAARDVLAPQPPVAPPRASAEATRSREQASLVLPRASVDATRSREQPRIASPLDQRRPLDLPWPAETEPAIQVTIGRIEVRAEHASSLPLAKARSNLKPMSLDEYLRRRTGKDR